MHTTMAVRDASQPLKEPRAEHRSSAKIEEIRE
jgi:hypothetical protein